MYLGTIGSGVSTTNLLDDAIQVGVRTGDSVVVTNTDPANTLGVLANGYNGAVTTIAAAGGTSTFTVSGPFWLFANTAGQRVNLKITGGMY